MGIIHSIDSQARIVRMEYHGRITLDDFRVALDSVLKSASYRPGFGFLVDRRDALPPTASYLQDAIAFAAERAAQLARARWAVVANPAYLEASLMGETLGDRALLPQCIRIFEDLVAAEDWLRLTAEED